MPLLSAYLGHVSPSTHMYLDSVPELLVAARSGWRTRRKRHDASSRDDWSVFTKHMAGQREDSPRTSEPRGHLALFIGYGPGEDRHRSAGIDSPPSMPGLRQRLHPIRTLSRTGATPDRTRNARAGGDRESSSSPPCATPRCRDYRPGPRRSQARSTPHIRLHTSPRRDQGPARRQDTNVARPRDPRPLGLACPDGDCGAPRSRPDTR